MIASGFAKKWNFFAGNLVNLIVLPKQKRTKSPTPSPFMVN
jgi:hypothetical protein